MENRPVGQNLHRQVPKAVESEEDAPRVPALAPSRPLTGFALPHGSIASAYQMDGAAVRYGSSLIRPTALYIPADPTNPRPPSPRTFASFVPMPAVATFTPTELEYAPAPALDPRVPEITSAEYALQSPPEGYVPPPSLAPKGTSVKVDQRELIRKSDVRPRLHHTIDSWISSAPNLLDTRPTDIDLLSLSPDMLRQMRPEDRDKLLDQLEDHGEAAIVVVKDRDKKWRHAVGRATTLALLADSVGRPEDYGAVIGARPIPIIPELFDILGKYAFSGDAAPWIAYYALPRLSHGDTFEMAFACCAVVSAVSSSLNILFQDSGKPGKDPREIYNKFKGTIESMPSGILQRLAALPNEQRSLYHGRLCGAMMAGALSYAMAVERHDQKKRDSIQWGLKISVDLIATGATAAFAPALPLLPIIVPALNHMVDALGKPISEAIIKNKHWLDVLETSKEAFHTNVMTRANAEARRVDGLAFLDGYETIIRLSQAAQKVYATAWTSDSKLAAVATRHPHLQDFIKAVFDHRVVPPFMKSATMGHRRAP